ncbi:hypothetical protein ACOSP7_014629 [Xanthoceras sorbifolium]
MVVENSKIEVVGVKVVGTVMATDLPAIFVAELQPAFNGPYGAIQVHSQAPPPHFVTEYNYFPPPAHNNFNEGQFQPQHQCCCLLSFSTHC